MRGKITTSLRAGRGSTVNKVVTIQASEPELGSLHLQKLVMRCTLSSVTSVGEVKSTGSQRISAQSGNSISYETYFGTLNKVAPVD